MSVKRIMDVFLTTLTLIAGLTAPHPSAPREVPWFQRYDLVAHACGRSPNGKASSNSLEALESNYQQGYRVFEVDLTFTADGELVLAHDWGNWTRNVGIEYTGEVITYEQFMSTKLYGLETPMDLAALIDRMAAHEDMYCMTDFKRCYEMDVVVSAFQAIVQAAGDAGHMEVLDRFIIQNHHNDFKHWVDEVYPFQNWLYTMYSIREEEDRIPENVVAYCEKEGIAVIAMGHTVVDRAWIELARQHGIRIFVHTVNGLDYANSLMAAGVAGVYTDDIKPGQLLPSAWREPGGGAEPGANER